MREEAFRVFGFMAFGIVITLGLLAVVQMLSMSPLWNEGGAAWVQAIGSIAAILAAIWVGDRAARKASDHAEKMHSLITEKRHSAMRAILDDADFQCRYAARDFEGDGDFGNLSFIFSFNLRKFDAVLAAVEGIPLHELDSYHAAEGIAGLRNSMIRIKQTIQSVLDPSRPPSGGDEPDDWVKDLGRNQCDEARAFYSLAVVALGGMPNTRVATDFDDAAARIYKKVEQARAARHAVVIQDSST